MTYRSGGYYSREYDEKKEIDEAINAANDALYHLDQADQLLSKAKNWGIADILGGGMFISLIKRSKMQDAQRELRASQNALQKLNKELSDIRGYTGLDLQTDDFMMIADVWFDNAFMDLMQQNRINKSAAAVKNAIAEVEGLLDGLEDLKLGR